MWWTSVLPSAEHVILYPDSCNYISIAAFLGITDGVCALSSSCFTVKYEEEEEPTATLAALCEAII